MSVADLVDAVVVDVVVVGAGAAGLSAARHLDEAGRRVVVLDKGRGVGGRLATRRIGDATLDHGAQFITAHGPAFSAVVEDWARTGAVVPWYRSVGGHRHWRGAPTMNALAKRLAAGLEVRTSTPVASIEPVPDGWLVRVAGGDDTGEPTGRTFVAAEVVVTAPVPQALDLLAAVDLDTGHRRALESIRYAPCLAALVPLDAPVDLGVTGHLEPGDGPIAWLGENRAKGVSSVPALTVHASADWSAIHVDDEPGVALDALLVATAEVLGRAVAARD